jgi:hypothetical protein
MDRGPFALTGLAKAITSLPRRIMNLNLTTQHFELTLTSSCLGGAPQHTKNKCVSVVCCKLSRPFRVTNMAGFKKKVLL